jgi:hypothetical protein
MQNTWKIAVVSVVMSLAILVGLTRTGSATITATFSRYAEYSAPYVPHESGVFLIRNTGSRPAVCRGVGSSSEQQLIQVLTPHGWVHTDRPWLSPGSAVFELGPGQAREVPVLIETNLPWRVGFRFRERGFVDVCPWFVWRIIPGRLQHVPVYREVWTEPVLHDETNKGI